MRVRPPVGFPVGRRRPTIEADGGLDLPWFSPGGLIMPFTHTNRRGQTYYLHAGTTRTGKPRYWFSMKDVGDLVEAIPADHEVYENPDAQVFLRKAVPQLVTP